VLRSKKVSETYLAQTNNQHRLRCIFTEDISGKENTHGCFRNGAGNNWTVAKW
jgi:hypothetical protein